METLEKKESRRRIGSKFAVCLMLVSFALATNPSPAYAECAFGTWENCMNGADWVYSACYFDCAANGGYGDMTRCQDDCETIYWQIVNYCFSNCPPAP